MTRLFFLILLLISGLCTLAPKACAAKGYPDHPIQMIIPYPAGGQGDTACRMLIEELDKSLGTRIIPNNRPGAGTVLGADAAVRAKKDGYTLFYASASPVIYVPITNPEVVHYDPMKDLEPLGFHFLLPTVVGVKADAPWKTFPEFVEYARRNPGKIRMTSVGVGSFTHFAIELLQSITGIKVTHVPYEGGESVVTGVLGGHVEAALDGYGKFKPHVEAGRMRVLLIDPMLPNHPEIPTLRQLGYKQSLPATWFADPMKDLEPLGFHFLLPTV
ncbi:MAG: tripartite tricarboxylate transporter substrate binding protein, partial [Syntrophales bacterium LBB04]|nr:tripartite tricarboxylate transporter substrate binding protein [Syntrophales bacterium LBB04]